MGVAIEGGRLALTPYDELTRLPRDWRCRLWGKITGKVSQVLFDIVRACAAVVSALVAVIRLVWDIVKDRKQKSNRPDQG